MFFRWSKSGRTSLSLSLSLWRRAGLAIAFAQAGFKTALMDLANFTSLCFSALHVSLKHWTVENLVHAQTRIESSENLEEVPRIWEGEGSWRSEILNPSNNDHWVLGTRASKTPSLTATTKPRPRHDATAAHWRPERSRGLRSLGARQSGTQ